MTRNCVRGSISGRKLQFHVPFVRFYTAQEEDIRNFERLLPAAFFGANSSCTRLCQKLPKFGKILPKHLSKLLYTVLGLAYHKVNTTNLFLILLSCKAITLYLVWSFNQMLWEAKLYRKKFNINLIITASSKIFIKYHTIRSCPGEKINSFVRFSNSPLMTSRIFTCGAKIVLQTFIYILMHPN